MRILKTGGIILLTLVGLVFVVALIAPKAMQTEQSIVIEAPPEVVFNTVNDLRTWESWSTWKEMDPGMKITMGDPAVGEGAYYSWSGDQTGEGRLKILGSRPNEHIKTDAEFGWMGGAIGTFTFKPADQHTKVSWDIDMGMTYPINTMFLFMDRDTIDGEFKRGLELLKAYVEKEYAATKQFNDMEIKLVELPKRHYIAVREVVPMEKVSDFYAKNLPVIQQTLQREDIEIVGYPCGLFYSWEEEKQQTDMAGAMPLAKEASVTGFESITLPAGKVLQANYYGDYQGIAAAHTAIDKYVSTHDLKTSLPIIEEYVTDPGQEPDPAKWLTRVYYPLQER